MNENQPASLRRKMSIYTKNDLTVPDKLEKLSESITEALKATVKSMATNSIEEINKAVTLRFEIELKRRCHPFLTFITIAMSKEDAKHIDNDVLHFVSPDFTLKNRPKKYVIVTVVG